MGLSARVSTGIAPISVGLSTSDADKWRSLVERSITSVSSAYSASVVDPRDKEARLIRQRQKRLTSEEERQVISQYRACATVSELADIFNCHRTTISACLKRHHIQMRRTPLAKPQIDEAVQLYESGLSLEKVGKQIGVDAETIRQRLRERFVSIRGPHDRRTRD